MAVLIRGGGEQQFTCFFKSTRVCEETCDGSWRAGAPALAAKGNLRPSKRNKVCMSWNRAEEQMMKKVSFFLFFFWGFCVKPPVKHTLEVCFVLSVRDFPRLIFRKSWTRVYACSSFYRQILNCFKMVIIRKGKSYYILGWRSQLSLS